MAKIRVKIAKDGKVETEVQGVKGTGCQALLDALTANLGATIEDNATGEYYEAEQGEYVVEGN